MPDFSSCVIDTSVIIKALFSPLRKNAGAEGYRVLIFCPVPFTFPLQGLRARSLITDERPDTFTTRHEDKITSGVHNPLQRYPFPDSF
jgi:hypothetical protein